MVPPPSDMVWNTFPRVIPEARKGAPPLPFHRLLPGYEPTPIVELTDLAREVGIGRITAKIETTRLGLPAFKILGASWAIYRELCRRLPGLEERWESLDDLRQQITPLGELTFVAATDGNHGRAVAHMARQLGQRAHILVPAGMAPARIDAIESEGAAVEVIDGTYDDAIVASAALMDRSHLVISDTAWDGYQVVPRDVIAGYSTIFAEAAEQMDDAPTQLFIQMGVGALGTAAILASRPWKAKVVSVEPKDAACILASIREKELTEVPGPHRSIMAGLNCGIPSPIAWPLLQTGIDLALAIPDDAARSAMRMLADAGVVAGETGAAGVAGLMSLATSPNWPEIRKRLKMDASSHVLVIITEGATDPAAWEAITGRRLL
ncbi:MAG TPA: diaminopropionate ammonia-lyase [Thermomicrobiales bacterium]|nr:diaminopropionate ammonia-lyase [Thermomicrobiales bacterium]